MIVITCLFIFHTNNANGKREHYFKDNVYIGRKGLPYDTLKILLLFNRDGHHGPMRLNNVSVHSSREYCLFHKERSLLNQSDVVIMKAELLLDEDEVPERSSVHQQWIYYVWEAAKTNLISGHPDHNNKFNLTMTYSKQSEIFVPYGDCRKLQKVEYGIKKNNISDIVKRKDKFVAWFLSSCKSRSLRENYVRALLQYIPVDVYGDCGNRTCLPGPACDRFISTYKFYLAFENSLCGEYITEKLWRSYERNMVPVVFGGLDAYKDVLPAHSYIAVQDFSSPKELADYLLLLDRDDRLYRSYFDWKFTYTCGRIMTRSLEVCRALHRHKHDKNDDFTLHHMWTSKSNQCVDTDSYLNSHGINDTVRKAFEKSDVHIYDNLHKSSSV